MKSNIYKHNNGIIDMNKRGDIIIVFAIIASFLVMGSIIYGTFLATENIGNINKVINYVGDSSTNHYYNVSCYKEIKPCNLVLFDDLEQVKNLNFTYNKECPK